MMLFWSNFAKSGSPGISTNAVIWTPYIADNHKNYLILDKKKNLKIKSMIYLLNLLFTN